MALALMGLHLAFFRPFFQSNDNVFKVFFAKGVGFSPGPSEFIAYSNVLLGFALKNLYQIAPHVQWFGWTLISTHFFYLWGLLFSLFLLRCGPLNLLFLLLACAGVECRYFSELQFTVTAALAAQASVFLWAALLESNAPKRPYSGYMLFLGLSLLSSLLRFSAYVLNLAFMAPFVGWVLWKRKFSAPRALRWTGFLALLLTFSGAGFNEYWHQEDPGWRDFDRFDSQRLAFMDYRVSRYDASTKPIFDSVHWTQNDYQMFKDWCYFDPVKFSTENLKKLADSFPQIGTTGRNDSAHSIPEMFSGPFCQTIFLYSILFLLFNRQEIFRLALIIFIWISAILVFLMFFYRCPERLYEPAFTFLLVLTLVRADQGNPLSDDERPPSKSFRWVRSVFLVMGCFLVFPTLRFYLHDNQRRIDAEEKYRLALLDIRPQPDQLFVVWASSLIYEQIDALDDYEIYRPFHFFSLAVYQRGPIGDEVLKRYGVKDPFRDLVNNKNMFLICSNQEGIYYTRYLEENFHLRIRARRVFTGPNFNVYQIVI